MCAGGSGRSVAPERPTGVKMWRPAKSAETR